MVKSKWFASLLLSTGLLAGSIGTAAAAEGTPGEASATAPSGKHITILHTNDTHARAVASSPEMGYPKVKGIFDQYRSQNPDTLTLDAGDTLHGTPFATLVRGESVVKVINEMGYDAMVPGNHDFNYGWNHLVELSQKLKFPIISSNVKKSDGTDLFKPYIIKEIDGVKIGIIGFSTPETAYKTSPKNVEGLKFIDPAGEAKKTVNELKGKVDVIIGVGHLGMDKSSIDTSLKLVKEVPGIDVFIDGHSHTVLEHGMQADNNTLIASTGEYTKNVGVVDLWVDGGKVVKKEAKLINEKQAADIKPDQKLEALVASIQKEQEPILKEKLGETLVKLEGSREKVRTGETNLGDLLTDAIRDVSKSDITITNGGGIRASIEAGTITKGNVITVLPFGNQIVSLKVTGEDIVAALENGVSDYPESKGGFPQVSGISFKIDKAKPKGSRVHSVMVGDKAIDPKATYTLATNDFMSIGGDEYKMFSKYPQAGMYGALDEALITYIQKGGKVAAEAQGRITEGAAPAAPAPQPEPTKPDTTVKPTEPVVTPQPDTTVKPTEPVVTPQPDTTVKPTEPVITPQPDTTVKPTKPAITPQPEPSKPAPVPAENIYIVKKGDSLYSISQKYGTTWRVLQNLNHIKNANLIYPGQKIKLPA
ncbi:5'-nucleotidase C-terminal domain-containing protein [Paenibacillus sp.]|jgi:2',3'-cyclic-nucleotide 2'-phosphodiesterase (5'-nucleotidase family)/LysM repeat protein|uniref:5'-nucleotidase C-terminal domain-containing protein n=1 Tax=Paenibacillus sp. TaxID=58172 RepID=UPI0028361C4E|nr:5'-nucleotidase C-terminal domain-containing protein [Paenibacillus sp.]MDR0268376.1 5'-nucleotidase C-terminal domain-containing protein [Paenibacillus sp.]